jgi:tRNA threonylcarbamoyladenosine biosynthesis protein TsaE
MNDQIKNKIIISSAEEMEAFAKNFAKKLNPGDQLGLIGELGAGKTTFVRGLYEGLTDYQDDDIIVSSPTFTIVQEYPLKNHQSLIHLDLYRLNQLSDYDELGLEENKLAQSILVIEWVDKFKELSDQLTYEIEICIQDDQRIIKIR